MNETYLWIAAICIFIVAFFLGWIISKTVRKATPDGVLIIAKNEDRDVYRWVLNEELEDLAKKKQLIIRVEHSQNSQPV